MHIPNWIGPSVPQKRASASDVDLLVLRGLGLTGLFTSPTDSLFAAPTRVFGQAKEDRDGLDEVNSQMVHRWGGSPSQRTTPTKAPGEATSPIARDGTLCGENPLKTNAELAGTVWVSFFGVPLVLGRPWC